MTATRWGILAGLLGLGVTELVRGLGHLLSEDSAAARAGLAPESVANPDVVYLFAVVGGTQALLGAILLASAVALPHLRAAAIVLEAARCVLTIAVGLAKPSTADGLVGVVPDSVQIVVSLVVVGLLVVRGRHVTSLARGSENRLPRPRTATAVQDCGGRWPRRR
ncbi:MAG: hypothetical protein H7Y15_07790 [Pseudonocardia sp.]|nr:hypothetical protein [Pseudonocardia sp.]